jgi:DNA-directed RNA polymerase subunit H (RpoH/RPB5)
MEDKAIEILQVMLSRRGLKTDLERIAQDDLEMANVYIIGPALVIFSQKQRTLTERDITGYLNYRVKAENEEKPMIIVAMASPSENVLRFIKTLSSKKVQVFHIKQLQFDLTTHRYAMPHRILKDEERTAILEAYNVTKPEDQLPWIDSQDAMAKWIGAVPGDIIEVTRHSDVAGRVPYYRYCVEDVNVA